MRKYLDWVELSSVSDNANSRKDNIEVLIFFPTEIQLQASFESDKNKLDTFHINNL